MSDFDLDREVSIEKNIDATGKKWIIHANRQNGLCYVRPEPDRSDAVIPKDLKGLWTKPSLLMPRLKKYLEASWDQAARAQQRNQRKQKVANDSGKSDD